MDTKSKKAKPVTELKDFLGQEVKVGDSVVVLYKSRGFRGIDRAYLWKTVYLGKGRYGHQFRNLYNGKETKPVNIKEPELIKIDIKPVLKIPESKGFRKEVAL